MVSNPDEKLHPDSSGFIRIRENDAETLAWVVVASATPPRASVEHLNDSE
jgi:hypothetical protein